MAKSATEAIRNYLMRGNSLTSLEALKLFGCNSLAQRIYDLRKKQGIPIDDEEVKFVSRYGFNGSYSKYYVNKEWLEKQIKPVGRPNVVPEKDPELFNEAV